VFALERSCTSPQFLIVSQMLGKLGHAEGWRVRYIASWAPCQIKIRRMLPAVVLGLFRWRCVIASVLVIMCSLLKNLTRHGIDPYLQKGTLRVWREARGADKGPHFNMEASRDLPGHTGPVTSVALNDECAPTHTAMCRPMRSSQRHAFKCKVPVLCTWRTMMSSAVLHEHLNCAGFGWLSRLTWLRYLRDYRGTVWDVWAGAYSAGPGTTQCASGRAVA
jgi:hypothetical protein